MAKFVRSHTAITLTLEREALEHPHIRFSFQRDPLFVAMSARGLDAPASRKPTGAKKDANGRSGRARGK
jgi:hypothetical protein